VVHIAATWTATRTMIAISAAQQERAAIGLTENVLFGLNQGYSVIGAHAIAFALWWALLRREK
jgi:hypothetical protein